MTFFGIRGFEIFMWECNGTLVKNGKKEKVSTSQSQSYLSDSFSVFGSYVIPICR